MEKTIYVHYFDQIDPIRVKNIMAILSSVVSKEKPTNLYILLSSPGGDVNAGITLYHYLKSLPCTITMHNIGTIDSIANVIFVAGSKRYASPHTSFLFHGAKMTIIQPVEFTLNALQEHIDMMDKSHLKIGGIICGNTEMSPEEIKNLFLQGKTIDTDIALEKGIIHEVKTLQIPQDALYITININT